MEPVISFICPIVVPISRMASTVEPVASRISWIWLVISSVALAALRRQRLDLVGHDGKAPARVAGPGRLDGRVQGQQIGLSRDGLDQRHDLADLLRGLDQAPDHGLGPAGLPDRVLGDGRRLRDLPRDLLDRGRQLLRRSRTV